jgi:Zn-dependent metalloprotease
MRRLRSVVVLALVPVLAMLGLVPGPAQAREHGLKLVSVKQSLIGTHHWYQQTYRGLPVIDGYLARHMDRSGTVVKVSDGRLEVRGDVATTPGVSSDRARSAADRRLAGFAGKARLAILAGRKARLVWTVPVTRARTDARVVVDARTGGVLRVDDLLKEATGSGRVFDPNPVVTLQDQTLTDQDDADHAALQPAYRTATLTNLDGSGFLHGDFAFTALNKKQLAFSSTLVFDYDRFDDRFEQVMAYHDATRAQVYIQSLGFLDVNSEPQDLLPNRYKGDNSFYSPSKDTITLGIGGVDDAEDADVTWHEYGHAIQDSQVPGYGRGHDAGSIGEGFSDYWAVTMSQPVNAGYEVPCVADWDSVSYTSTVPHCLRRTDLDLTVADQTGGIHHDGQIWSRALWDINQDLGRDVANRIILEAPFLFAPDTSFAAAAQDTVDTARALFGNRAGNTVQGAFQDRGIL